MKSKFLKLAIGLLLVASMLFPSAAAAGTPPPPDLTTLEPGGFRTIQQALDINVVFIGFDPSDVDTGSLETALPGTYRTIIRYPAFYGIQQFLGNDFTFNYNFIFAGDLLTNDFFTWLGLQGATGDPTLYQNLYNSQVYNLIDVTAPVRYIDAPSVEEYLESNSSSLLGDYTVFFINWYGRDDFQFHVYTKTDQVDPDTGYNFGTERDSRKMVGWGGSTGRTWFYDFSAGPEAWANNWVVDPENNLGYTIPPIWEYGNTDAYRPFDDLTGDLARLVRFVAIDLLFTPSPLYKPLLSPPDLPQSINIDINLFEGDPSKSGLDYVDQGFVQAQYTAFQPYKTFNVDLNDYPLAKRISDIFDCWAANQNSCYGYRLFNIAFGDLFLYAKDHILQYLNGNANYEIPIFAYYVPMDRMGANVGLLGYADDDWATGTQSYIFAFDTSEYNDLGYGFSTTFVHEAGHHVGLSHPHDGYDYEYNLDFVPDGDYQFVWAGDESDSIMHYMNLSVDFGIFNQDSMYRYETAGYINEANAILAHIYDSPQAYQVSGQLLDADSQAALALTDYVNMDYLAAVEHAQMAYESVVSAAAAINIPVEPESWQADVKSKGRFEVDPVRYPDN